MSHIIKVKSFANPLPDSCVASSGPSSAVWDTVYSCLTDQDLVTDTQMFLEKDTLLTTIPELGKEWEVSLLIQLPIEASSK